MVNNLEDIKPYLKWETADVFYHLQVLKRKKENPMLDSNSYTIKTYYIRSMEELDRKWDEIVSMCESNNARAMINLNKRSFEAIAFHTLRKISEQIFNKKYDSVKSSYDSVCGKYSATGIQKYWLVDIDDTTEIDEELINTINSMEPDPYSEKVLGTIPTKTGYHLVTKPFRLDMILKLYPKLEVKKNNPTNIFIP